MPLIRPKNEVIPGQVFVIGIDYGYDGSETVDILIAKKNFDLDEIYNSWVSHHDLSVYADMLAYIQGFIAWLVSDGRAEICYYREKMIDK